MSAAQELFHSCFRLKEFSDEHFYLSLGTALCWQKRFLHDTGYIKRQKEILVKNREDGAGVVLSTCTACFRRTMGLPRAVLGWQ